MKYRVDMFRVYHHCVEVEAEDESEASDKAFDLFDLNQAELEAHDAHVETEVEDADV
jgi:hypothetical protein